MSDKKQSPYGPRPKFEIDYNDFKNQAQIQQFINKQLWMAGGQIQTAVGTTTTTTVKWGGQSRFLAGFNFYSNNPNLHSVSVILNQETIIDNVPLPFLSPNGAFGNMKFQQYFEFIRPLSGSDVMIFSINSQIAEQVSYGIYMTRAYNRYYTRD